MDIWKETSNSKGKQKVVKVNQVSIVVTLLHVSQKNIVFRHFVRCLLNKQ